MEALLRGCLRLVASPGFVLCAKGVVAHSFPLLPEILKAARDDYKRGQKYGHHDQCLRRV
jgi:hypothetical protein